MIAVSLTAKQARLLDYLMEYRAHHTTMPTMQEMCAGTGTTSKSSIWQQINQLEARGHLTRIHGKARAIALVPQVDLKAENERLRAALRDLIDANFDADAQRAGAALERAMEALALPATPEPR